MVLRKTKKYSRSRKPSEKMRKPVAIVVSLFNDKVTTGLLTGAKKGLEECGWSEKQFRVLQVAGVFEIPFVAQRLAVSKKYAGIVALGCVIRGETPHFEYVSRAVTDGVLRVQLDTGCPITFGILTVDNQEQALVRSANNQFNKGTEAAVALNQTIDIMETI